MRAAGLAAFVGMSLLTLLAQSAPALAEADCKAVVAPSPFGPDVKEKSGAIGADLAMPYARGINAGSGDVGGEPRQADIDDVEVLLE